jgi:tRNA (guanine26-N2/guanine27-N2)-dimethyltransferase
MSAIANLGYKVSNSHAKPHSIKTNAPSSILWAILKVWQKNHDTQKAKPVSQTSPAFVITAKEYGIESQVSFEHNADAVPGSIKLKLLRYQTNANWGPQKRPDKAIKDESNKKQRIE